MVVLMSGCATMDTGSTSQASKIAYSNNRRLANIENNLAKSMDKLNETTTSLSSRVEESDRQTRLLQNISEENQVRLEQLQAKLDELASILYKQYNLTPPSESPILVFRSPMSLMEEDENVVVVDPPSQVAGRPKTEEALATPDTETVVEQPVGEPVVETVVAPSLGPTRDYYKAQESYKKDDFPLASQQYSAYLLRYPDSLYRSNAQFWLAQCFYKLGQYDKAATEYETLWSQYPESTYAPIALYNQAELLKNDKAREAVVLLDRLLQKYPDSPLVDKAKTTLGQLRGY